MFLAWAQQSTKRAPEATQPPPSVRVLAGRNVGLLFQKLCASYVVVAPPSIGRYLGRARTLPAAPVVRVKFQAHRSMTGDGVREDGHLVVFQGRAREIYADQSDGFVTQRAVERVFFRLQRRAGSRSDPRSIATFGHDGVEVTHHAVARGAGLVQFVTLEPRNTMCCASVRIMSTPVVY